MEADGQPLTPGTSNGPLSYGSARNPGAPNFLHCSLESSCSPNLGDGLMTSECTWDLSEEDEPETSAADPQRSEQRRFKSSAFPSSLSWDSDSEKETLDEEELQNFSNPHGLATHSPGSPSTGLRLEGEDDQEFEKLHSFNSTTGTSTPAEGCSDNNERTKKEEPDTRQPGQTESADNRVWSVSEAAEPFLSKGKPKEEEAESGKGETRPKGQEAREPERDVYTFPGDSDPESPPPAPWAHCTFIQRCRKKRALLRPFSGIGSPESQKLDRLSPQASKTDETPAPSRAAGVYEFEEVGFDEGEAIGFRDGAGKGVEEEKSEWGSGNEIFTCVECSIYFKKQVHLQEHMAEHCQTSAGASRRSGKGSRLRCAECGWNLPNRPALADHQRRHQESRLKILEEIEKLNENETAKESEAPESGAAKRACADPTVAQYTGPALNPGETSDREVEKSPAPSAAAFSVQDADLAVVDVHSVPPSSVRSAPQAHRRRFVCSECNFSTRTSQALANHSKIHKRKKQILHPHPAQKALREQQTLARPEKMSTKQQNETSRSSTSNAQIVKSAPDCHYLSESESLPGASPVRGHGDITASEDSTASDRGAARPECVASRRFSAAGEPHVDTSRFDPEADDDTLPGSEAEERDSDHSEELKPSQREASSPVGRKLHNTEEPSPQQEAAVFPPAKKRAKDQEEDEAQKGRRVFFLRRSSRVTAAQAQTESDDDTDGEHMPCFLSEGVFGGDEGEMDEAAEALRSVERKCPYCPDRFHNGIGLANHVRGHLKRVGVSYNVRHFISPEEVNAIEKKFSYQKKKKKGNDEAADEEDEEGHRLTALDGLCSSPGKKDSLSLREDVDGKVQKWKCEVCDSQFESRRGLSIHSRAHLRQLGFTVSESGGSAIDLLHQIAMERSIDGKISSSLLTPKKPSQPVSLKDEKMEDMELDEKPIPLSLLAKAAKAVPSGSATPTPSPGASPAPAHSNSPSSVVKKAPISSLLPVSSPLRSPEHKVGGLKSLTANLSAASGSATSKPLWAPQENDAPLNLTLDADSDKDIVCQLCGAWFETRKGLSSHARAHLRHFGVEYSESKGSPIELLSQLMDTDDFKHKASALELDCPSEAQDVTPAPAPAKQSLLTLSSSSSAPLLYKVTTVGGGSKATSSSASSLPAPPAKRLKTSSMQVFRLSSGELMALPHNDPPKEIGCEYCGEYFENRKGLSSHARSHLRQMGITEWSVNGSPIDTLREIITRRGLPCALPLKPLKTPPPSSPGPPRSPLSASSSPSATLLGRLPFAFARPSSPPQSAMSKSGSAPPMSSSSLTLKPKPEPVQVEVTAPGSVGRSGGFPVESPNSNWSNPDKAYPLNLAMGHEVEPTRDIRCEFCGEYFENRKGLSSHARSHLRQMGITEWSVNGSPIDTLREVMHKRGSGGSSRSDQGVKRESRQGTNSPLWENVGGARGSEALGISGYQSSKFHKSPLSLVQSGSRILKQGPPATQPAGKMFRLSPLGKRLSSERAQSAETAASQAHRLKTFPSLPHDFSYKRKPSPEKHGHQDPSCELCGFYFENRKALASHARAHLRQFGVTEWSVNGSPIETLSAWIRSRPQKVLEMHRNYMQGNRSTLKKKAQSSSTQWSSSLAAGLARPRSQELRQGSSEAGDVESGIASRPGSVRAGGSSPTLSRLGSSLQAQVARSELNVRLPRGFERRPLKHPSCPDGADRDSGSPKPPRTGTVPSLVPKPPSYPLVKLVGKFYTLKCRFCEVEFHGPLSVQEDWIRHLQQHIFKMNYKKPAALKAAPADGHALADNSAPVQASVPASDSSSRTASTPTRSTAPNSRSSTPVAEFAPAITASEITKVSEEQSAMIPTPIPLPTQVV
ncbi:protein Wiz isoform X4 [Fundulus heteroclitus]|uniref:protein Wiz isoform X4 n=1 Tax=Fundulus heteroclitus TaxID=8078 RepID=UPI00165BC022|nr:protein Wiz isoform X4 [Fundulus heteroclitus]